jgi:hypothetical protein
MQLLIINKKNKKIKKNKIVRVKRKLWNKHYSKLLWLPVDKIGCKNSLICNHKSIPWMSLDFYSVECHHVMKDR